jgi:hypothetical protein
MNEILVARLHAAGDALSDCAQALVPTAKLMHDAASVIEKIPTPRTMRGFMVPESVLVDAVTEALTLDGNIIVEVDNGGAIYVKLPSRVNDVLKRIHPKPVER